MSARPFRILGLQQVAIGGPRRAVLEALWVELLGVPPCGEYTSAAENVDESILRLGVAPHEVEIDLMQPVDPEARPRVHQPPLNHLGLWVDDLAAAARWLEQQGVRFTPGGIRKGAAGHDVCFIHPKGNDAAPRGGEGVLIELVQAPAEVIAAHGPSAPSSRRALYPAVEPYATGRLPVSDGHVLHYEICGNPEGKPVVFLHGGPGGGCVPDHRRFFDPDRYRVILFDQRGAGQSTPHAGLDANTTDHLIADIEALREAVGVDRWMVFGGSWGSTLALAYAQAHPASVTELVLRGIFMGRPEELRWFYQEGASALYPDRYAHYRDFIPASERGDLLAAYHRRLTGEDEALRLEAARRWSDWEFTTSTLTGGRATPEKGPRTAEEDHLALAIARIEAHYFVHGNFLEPRDRLLRDVDIIREIPAVIVHGRHDVICPIQTAQALADAWPEATLEIIEDAGHSAMEPGIIDALVRATDRFAAP